MPKVPSIPEATQSIDSRSVFLVITIVGVYFLFQLTLIFTGTVGTRNACLYTFWAPYYEWWRNPFGLVVLIVFCLLTLSGLLLLDGIRQHNRSRIVTGIGSVLIVGLWLYGLYGFWNAMLYERGEISREQWYGDDSDWKLPWFSEEKPCDPVT